MVKVLNFLECHKNVKPRKYLHQRELLTHVKHATNTLGFVYGRRQNFDGRFSMIFFIILVNVGLLLFNEIVAL